RRVLVHAYTSSAGAAAHVRERIPAWLASIRFGRRIELGDDGIAVYAPGQASRDLTNSGLLLGASPGKDAHHHSLVPFVTRVLIYRVVCPFEANHGRPGRGPRRGIREGNLVVDLVGRRACEALDHVQVLGRSEKAALRRKIRRLDDQRVSVPSTARVPEPGADVSR